MPEVKREKNVFDFSRGLNTVSSEIGFLDGFTTDERNYVINRDGSRRRRKGLQEEASGVQLASGYVSGSFSQAFKWQAAGGDPTKNLMVYQNGYDLYFTDDEAPLSDGWFNDFVYLASTNLLVDSSTSANDVAAEPCSFAVHRGNLIVTHKYTHPLVISVDPSTEDISTDKITIFVRDFEDVEDGYAVDYQPLTLSAAHRYNLLNRGWKQADITAYQSSSSNNTYPAKNMVWYKGYKRTYAASIYEADGDRSWDTDKMEKEVFANSSAPRGSLFLNPLNTTVGILGEAGGAATVAMSFGSGNFAGSPTSATTVTVTATAHGQTAGGSTFTCSGQAWTYDLSIGGQDVWSGLNRTWTPTATAGTAPTAAGQVQVSNANTLIFYVEPITNWSAWQDTTQDGQVDGTDAITKSDGAALTVGPTVCESWAGRVWYAGIPDNEWADTIMFSRVALKSNSYGKCYQAADPTDELNNQLRDDDGGTIVIPNMGEVKQMKGTRDSLLVFATNGVWEISGGRGQGFTAIRKTARQLTDSGCTAPASVVSFENYTAYAGPRGVMILAPNQYTGLLEASVLSDVIETTWTGIDDARKVYTQCAYDENEKRLYVALDNVSASNFPGLFTNYVYNFRTNGWYHLEYKASSAWGPNAIYSSRAEGAAKMKFITRVSNSAVEVHDLDSADYVDWNGTESPLPYLDSGWEGLGDYQRRKQAPVITVYNKHTGTGWTDTGGGVWTEDNEGSSLLRGKWDWTDNTTPNKFTDQIETYRRVRSFTPIATDSESGQPLLVTRNKLRGRGRVLQIRFDGATGKDSHILGFTSNYKIKRAP